MIMIAFIWQKRVLHTMAKNSENKCKICGATLMETMKGGVARIDERIITKCPNGHPQNKRPTKR